MELPNGILTNGPGLAVVFVVIALYLGAIAYAIVRIVRTWDLSDAERLVWVLAILWAPLLGALVWFVAGPHPFGLRLTRHVR